MLPEQAKPRKGGPLAAICAVVQTELWLLLAMGVFYLGTSYYALKRMEWLARVEATLSLRWQ